ncbi:MAG: hypothetical protein ABJC19_11290 [Gemmatimonadota bacterium]
MATTTRSTRAFFLRGAREVLFYTLFLTLLDSCSFVDPQPFGDSVATACLLAVGELAWLYRKPEWREAVDPVQVLGLGLASATVGVTLFLMFRANAPDVDLLEWFIFGAVLLVPIFLVVASVREIRLREHSLPPVE